MPRVREFDEEKLVEDALELFWLKGYVDTSMRDLSAHTGVAHAGLYSAFGSKRKLFAKSLDLYREQVLRPMMLPVASEDSGRSEIEGFFSGLIAAMEKGFFKHGCFLCNSAIEFGDDGGPILKQVRGNFDRMLKAFEGALRRAVARGEVRGDLEPGPVASALVGSFAGAAVMLRAGIPTKQAVGGLRLALSKLD